MIETRQAILPLLSYSAHEPRFQNKLEAQNRMFASQQSAANFGLYLAPVIPAVLVSSSVYSRSVDVTEALLFATLGFVFYGLSLVITALIGLPVLFLLARFRLMAWWTTLTSGLGGGVLFAMLLGGGYQQRAAILYGAAGLGASSVFWIFWRCGPNPTEDCARRWVRGFVGRHRSSEPI